MAVLGPAHTASSRLNLTQAFNSLGTTFGPFVGSMLILTAPGVAGGAGIAVAGAAAHAVQLPYLGLAAALLLIALAFSQFRLPDPGETHASEGAAADLPSVWSYRHLALGAVAIFTYVGAEVSIGSFLVNFMSRPEIGGLSESVAGKYLSLYWGGAMVGRFIGAGVLRRVNPGVVLACNGCIVLLLLSVAMATGGAVAMWSVIAIGLFNSIMFPTIFALAIDGLGPRTGEGSGVLCMAIVGGAILPVLQGFGADHVGILRSFAVPLVCYLYIVYYGLDGHRRVRADAASPSVTGGHARHASSHVPPA